MESPPANRTGAGGNGVLEVPSRTPGSLFGSPQSGPWTPVTPNTNKFELTPGFEMEVKTIFGGTALLFRGNLRVIVGKTAKGGETCAFLPVGFPVPPVEFVFLTGSVGAVSAASAITGSIVLKHTGIISFTGAELKAGEEIQIPTDGTIVSLTVVGEP